MNSVGIVLCKGATGQIPSQKCPPGHNDDEYASTGETKQLSFSKIG